MVTVKGDSATVPLAEALALVALSFAALTTLGAELATDLPAGTALAELACIALPTVLWLRWRRVPAAALGIVPAPRPGWSALGGLLAGAGAFYVVAALVEGWFERMWPTPPALREALTRMVIPATGARPLALDLLTLALVPALAEELLFRGVLFGAVRPRLGAARPSSPRRSVRALPRLDPSLRAGGARRAPPRPGARRRGYAGGADGLPLRQQRRRGHRAAPRLRDPAGAAAACSLRPQFQARSAWS